MQATAANFMNIEPRILPHGPLDAAVGLAVGLLQLFAVIVVALIPAVVVSNMTQSALVVLPTFLVSFLIVSLIPNLFVVWRLRCDAERLEFVRALGRPKKIPWSKVESIEAASQAEVILQGWLWPRFPMREMSPSMSSIGHYRISWQGGAAYFPPADVQRFHYAMQIGHGYAAAQRRDVSGRIATAEAT